jgi:hypothetical protein
VEIFKEKNPNRKVRVETIFYSPIVLFSWDRVAEALVKSGIAKKEGETYYLVDLPRLIKMVIAGATWKDIGLPELYGKISIMCTDPNKSNSGNFFAALLAQILLGDTANEDNIDGVLIQIRKYFLGLGYLEGSSGDLFDQYLRTGVGARPIIVGYENQMIEFAAANPDLWPKVKDRVKVLYPVPTVWSGHALIALTDKGQRLITALQDPQIQAWAWQFHGFRTGLAGGPQDLAKVPVAGVPDRIERVVPMPSPATMERIMAALRSPVKP